MKDLVSFMEQRVPQKARILEELQNLLEQLHKLDERWSCYVWISVTKKCFIGNTVVNDRKYFVFCFKFALKPKTELHKFERVQTWNLNPSFKPSCPSSDGGWNYVLWSALRTEGFKTGLDSGCIQHHKSVIVIYHISCKLERT